jgi:hypothetical protein
MGSIYDFQNDAPIITYLQRTKFFEFTKSFGVRKASVKVVYIGHSWGCMYTSASELSCVYRA